MGVKFGDQAEKAKQDAHEESLRVRFIEAMLAAGWKTPEAIAETATFLTEQAVRPSLPQGTPRTG